MNRLQIRSFGPDSRSFLPHSYGYEPASERKPGLKRSNFRFGPASPPGSQAASDFCNFYTVCSFVREDAVSLIARLTDSYYIHFLSGGRLCSLE